MVSLRAAATSKVGLVLMACVTLASIVPLLAVLASTMVASALGCPLDEGSMHPCWLAGADIGDALYTAFVMGWLMLLTAPVMAVAALFWIVVGVRSLLARRRI